MEINVRFTHPRDSTILVVELSTQFTAEQIIHQLFSPQSGPFLQPLQPGQEYLLVLQRTNSTIQKHETLASANVNNYDTLAIILSGGAA